MKKFELTSAFLIGQEEIDSDHTRLVAILNEMVDGFDLGDRGICQSKWQEFCEKLEQHFSDEIRIMNSYGYHREDHNADHQKILDHIKKMGKKDNSLENWELCLFEMRNNLLSWILKHDLTFAEYLVTIGHNNP